MTTTLGKCKTVKYRGTAAVCENSRRFEDFKWTRLVIEATEPYVIALHCDNEESYEENISFVVVSEVQPHKRSFFYHFILGIPDEFVSVRRLVRKSEKFLAINAVLRRTTVDRNDILYCIMVLRTASVRTRRMKRS